MGHGFPESIGRFNLDLELSNFGALPDEISESIGTSTLFAAWNAAIYVAQIEDERLEPVVSSGAYLDATSNILHKHNGIWFNDEVFVVSKRRRK